MLKKAIWAGNYWIESDKIAEKMIKESLLDLIL
jgi:anti-sigma28 factor (negative regulator of flagellin synthesis)